MQNLVVFIEPSEDASNISAKAAKLYFNRFCIDEESACELSGVYYLESEEPLRITLKRKAEGKNMANLIHIINLRGQGDIQNRPKLFSTKAVIGAGRLFDFGRFEYHRTRGKNGVSYATFSF